MRKSYSQYISFLLPIIMSACSKLPPADDSYIANIVSDRLEKEVCWNPCGCEEGPICSYVQDLLSLELTVDTATQIALLNNPEIQAEFEEIGIAHADLVDAGLFKNPLFDVLFRIPDQSSLSLNTEFAITQAFLDIFLVPLRRKVAEAEFEKVKFKVANNILNIAFDVQETFYRLAAEQKRSDLLNTFVEASEAINQLAAAQKQQDNINEMELQSRMQEFLQAKIELSQSQTEIIKLREQLNRLLGLNYQETCPATHLEFPPLPVEEMSTPCLEEKAFSLRLDLEAAQLEVEKIIRMGALKQWWAYTDLAGGFAGEKDTDGTWTRGPALLGAIPIFNYGQADRARLYAMYRQSLDRLKALEIRIASEVRSASQTLQTHRNLVLAYENELIPLQEQILSTSQKYYNSMALSVYKLLNAKKQEIQTHINYTTALKNYWIARVELDRALGGSLH